MWYAGVRPVSELVVIVEGETEQAFVRDQLSAHLALQGISTWAVLPGRHRNRGGVKKWEVTRQDIIRTLKEGRYCSTMIDYYAMPEDWPGRRDANAVDWADRATLVEARLADDIRSSMGASFNLKFFIPYVQLHEFEALAFAGVEELVSVVSPLSDMDAAQIQSKFSSILEGAGHPEAIDDGYETCPSRRISGVVSAYKKRVHGPIVTSRIGIKALRERCNHFASWLERLEGIAS